MRRMFSSVVAPLLTPPTRPQEPGTGPWSMIAVPSSDLLGLPWDATDSAGIRAVRVQGLTKLGRISFRFRWMPDGDLVPT